MSKSNVNPLFKSLDERGEGAVSKAAIRERLAKSGIAIGDARLSRFRKKFDAHKGDSFNAAEFETLLKDNGSLFERVVQARLVVPDFSRFRDEIKAIYDDVVPYRSGSVADYIPQLARVPEDAFAVSVCTIDGQRLDIGDAEEWFTLQSSSKAVLYAAALEEHGKDKVHQHVGREPSGLSFNELTVNKNGLPHNPMINAGAIMTSSLIRRDLGTADRLEYLSNVYKAVMGNVKPRFNNSVFVSERETADRNFALAHHMRERGAFPENTEIASTLDYYFSACSLEVTASAMATMGATFANGGICPTTGKRVFSEDNVKNTLSMMGSCGMYDYSGEFAFSVGIPAKSSVSGVVFAVVPNLMGIAVWSPRLDECGNSVRGVEFLKRLVNRFNFHNYDSLVDSRKIDPRRVVNETVSNVTYQAIYAASIGDVDELKRLVARGHDLDIADYDGRTPLHLAAAENQGEAVEYLLSQGVSTDPRDRWGDTPSIEDINKEKAA